MSEENLRNQIRVLESIIYAMLKDNGTITLREDIRCNYPGELNLYITQDIHTGQKVYSLKEEK